MPAGQPLLFATLILLAWLATAATATYGAAYYCWRARQLPPPAATPAAVVLLPIKGASGLVSACLASLLDQDYPEYRIVASAESADDPAVPLIRRLGAEHPGRLTLVIAGLATERGQKVHNHLAALAELRPTDRIVAFADADVLPARNWLTQLVRPIANGIAEATSGYRWQVPADGALPSRLVSAVNFAIATTGRSRRWNLCWGGSTALKRETLDAIDLPRVWARALTDDLTLSAALSKAAIPVLAPLNVMVPSPTAQSWPSLLAFGRRQYLLLRMYRPRHWLVAGWILLVPVLGLAVLASGAMGWRLTALVLGIVVALQWTRQALRGVIARRLLPPAVVQAGRPAGLLAACAFPLVHAVHAAIFLTSAIGHRTRWAGILYRFDASTTTVLERKPPPDG